MSEDKLVQIGRFFDSTQAHIARGILETNDIHCFLFDENHTSTAWHLNIALGGTRLMILRSDLEIALEILEDFEEINLSPNKEKRAVIRKPYLKTIIGTLIGFFVGAPSIRPNKEKND